MPIMDRLTALWLCTVMVVVSVKGTPLIQDEDVDLYLTRLGYAPLMPNDILADGSKMGSSTARRDAIKKFQRFFHLRVTGELDDATKRKMSEPRCGFPDVTTGQLQRLRRLKKRASRSRRQVPSGFSRLSSVWEKPNLTWGMKSFTRKLSEGLQRSIMSQAVNVWAKEAPLTFREVSVAAEPDIEVSFGRYEHGDGRGNAFDGPGLTLAHAYGPGGPGIAGDVHFDDDEDWVSPGLQGTDMLVVAAHELGHSLGLGHSSDQNALMYPAYKDYRQLQLGADDIYGIRTLYPGRVIPPQVTPAPVTPAPVTPRTGRTVPPTRPTTRTTTTPTTTTPTTTTPDLHCMVPFDSVVDAGAGERVGFRGGNVYRMDDNGVKDGYPKPVSEEFPGGPEDVDMATSGNNGKIFITKSNKVWSYTNGVLEANYPKTFLLESFKEAPRFLLSFRDDYYSTRIFMFGSTFWWEYDFDRERTSKPMEYLIKQHWNDVSSNARYAFSNRQDIVIVSDDSHVVLSHRTRSAVGGVQPGLPSFLQNACRAIRAAESSDSNSASIPLVSMVTLLLVPLLSRFLV